MISISPSLTSLPELLAFAQRTEVYVEEEPPFDFLHDITLQLFDEIIGFETPKQRRFSPPNAISSLLHWKTLLLLGIKGHSLENLKPLRNKLDLARNCPPEGSHSLLCVAVDSHFHLDKLLHRHSASLLFDVFCDTGYIYKGVLTYIKFAIANYCFWATWPNAQTPELQEGTVKLSFGIHPRSAVHARQFHIENLENRLKTFPNVVALGEVGLDYSGRCTASEAEVQQRVLADIVPWAVKYKLPLVIHVRDNGDGLASQDCLKILGEYLPQEQPIHRHCFVGSVMEMQNWLEAFSGTVFGFTAKILNGDHHPDLPEAVRTLPLEKLLLETDSPYLPLPDRTDCTPNILPEIAEAVGRIKHLPFPVVLESSRRAACKFYGLPSC